MKGRTLLATTLVAVALAAAACGAEAPAITGAPYSCGTRQNSNIAFLLPKPNDWVPPKQKDLAQKLGDQTQPVMFDLSTFVAPKFPTTYYESVWRTSGGGRKIQISGDQNTSSMVCSRVITIEDYIIVFGKDSFGGLHGDNPIFGIFPTSAVYVFRNLPGAPPFNLGLVGAAPNHIVGGSADPSSEKAVVVKNYKNLGDLLIVGSEISYSSIGGPDSTFPLGHHYYDENNPMLNAIAKALGFKDYTDRGGTSLLWRINQTDIYPDKGNAGLTLTEALRLYQQAQQKGINTEVSIQEIHNQNNVQHGAKIAVYRLGGTVPYNPGSRPNPVILEKIAARQVMLAKDVDIKRMELVSRDGELMLELTVSAENPSVVREYTTARGTDLLQGKVPEVRTEVEGGRRYTVGPVQIPLSEIITEGILPTTPLLK